MQSTPANQWSRQLRRSMRAIKRPDNREMDSRASQAERLVVTVPTSQRCVLVLEYMPRCTAQYLAICRSFSGAFLKCILLIGSSLTDNIFVLLDTINTLLHEAIHAYFFVTTTWWRSDGDDGHGIGFQLLANAINKHGQYEITIYHTFHDEVDNFRTHIWQCDGVCKDRPPYFGLVKRSMNRPPGKSDTWWAQHESECGGTYVKIQEPEPTKKQVDAMSKKKRAGLQKSKLDGWLKVGVAKDKSSVEEDNTGSKAGSRKRKASTSVPDDIVEQVTAEQRRPGTVLSGGGLLSREQKDLVDCPICSERIPELSINQHLDEAHFV